MGSGVVLSLFQTTTRHTGTTTERCGGTESVDHPRRQPDRTPSCGFEGVLGPLGHPSRYGTEDRFSVERGSGMDPDRDPGGTLQRPKVKPALVRPTPYIENTSHPGYV